MTPAKENYKRVREDVGYYNGRYGVGRASVPEAMHCRDDEFLIVSFEWDDMEYPGNEYCDSKSFDSEFPQAAVDSSLGVLGHPGVSPIMYQNRSKYWKKTLGSQ